MSSHVEIKLATSGNHPFFKAIEDYCYVRKSGLVVLAHADDRWVYEVAGILSESLQTVFRGVIREQAHALDWIERSEKEIVLCAAHGSPEDLRMRFQEYALHKAWEKYLLCIVTKS